MTTMSLIRSSMINQSFIVHGCSFNLSKTLAPHSYILIYTSSIMLPFFSVLQLLLFCVVLVQAIDHSSDDRTTIGKIRSNRSRRTFYSGREHHKLHSHKPMDVDDRMNVENARVSKSFSGCFATNWPFKWFYGPYMFSDEALKEYDTIISKGWSSGVYDMSTSKHYIPEWKELCTSYDWKRERRAFFRGDYSDIEVEDSLIFHVANQKYQGNNCELGTPGNHSTSLIHLHSPGCFSSNCDKSQIEEFFSEKFYDDECPLKEVEIVILEDTNDEESN